MVLESTMICVDNSDYMRNGDFLPTRLQAQQDAVNLVCQSKIRTNAENNVGLLTLANVEVLATLTSDVGRILSKLHQVIPDGYINLLTGIRIAHLVLKHRQGKNHKMRIVAFVGSPVESEEKELVKLAKRLKKEKVSVDIVSFGEEVSPKVANNDLLTAFINTLNGKDGAGSHLVTVPPGPHLSDALISSPVIQGEDGMGGAGLGGSGFEFGVDPNEDPELALALRVSMEEQRQRQEEEARRAQAESTATATETPAGATPAGLTPATPMVIARDSASEEDMLERALAMSLEGRDSTPQPAVTTPATTVTSVPPQEITTSTGGSGLPDFDHMSEEEQIAFAMHMSMQDAQEQVVKVESPGKSRSGETPMEVEVSGGDDNAGDVEGDISEVMSDPAFLQSVLENLPGVDPQSEAVRQAVGHVSAAIAGKESKEGGGKKEKRGETSSSQQDKSDKKGSSDHERGKRK